MVCLLLGCGGLGGPDASFESASETPSGLSGRVLVRSDVQSIPDRPFMAGVLAVPADRGQAFLAALGTEDETQPPERLDVPLTPEAEALLVAHTESTEDGAYTLDIEPGTYWVCLSGIGDTADPQDAAPALVNGCARLDFQGAEPTDLYWGEAGVTTS